MKTIRMTLRRYLRWGDAITPVDLTEIRYFTVQSGQVGEYYITEHRIVYHEATAWGDHPWGQNDDGWSPGADFIHDWAHEDLLHDSPYESCNGFWRARGRWPGWTGPCDVLKRDGHYGTMENAEAAMREQVEAAYGHVKEQYRILAQLRFKLAAQLERTEGVKP